MESDFLLRRQGPFRRSVASAVDGVEQPETYYGSYLTRFLVTGLAPVGIIIYLWSLDPPLAVVMGVFLPLARLGPGLFDLVR
jgi:ABC-type transport system involved in cytochrome bd biosynthesis fused ATPase/permease subunit